MSQLKQINAAGPQAPQRVLQAVKNPPNLEGFIDEKQIFEHRLVPISRRTWGDWKKKGIIPYIRVQRRCVYFWPAVIKALRTREVGGLE